MKKPILLLLCLVLILSACGENPKPVPLKANVAKLKLTPPLEMKYALGGYGARMSKPAEVTDSIIDRHQHDAAFCQLSAVVTMPMPGALPGEFVFAPWATTVYTHPLQ